MKQFSSILVYTIALLIAVTIMAISTAATDTDNGVAELRSLGAHFTAMTNGVNPQGSGSKDISVIADGFTTISDSLQQYDTFMATYTDDLGAVGIQWFGVVFDNKYLVSKIVFWEGGHWEDGGWFGEKPFIQLLIDGIWTDASTDLEPEYPEDNYIAQQPQAQAYMFTLDNAMVCEGIRVLGKLNNLAGHASCSELEVYGSVLSVEAVKSTEIESDSEIDLNNENIDNQKLLSGGSARVADILFALTVGISSLLAVGGYIIIKKGDVK